MAWQQALRRGLETCCDVGAQLIVRGVPIVRFRPRCPLLLCSGATPGPFYHSHPHVPAEFDHLDFSMAAQVKANITAIRKIGDAVRGHAGDLPFALAPEAEWRRKPLLLHWISNNGDGFEANRKVCDEVTPVACAEEDMAGSQMLDVFEVGDNVSDRRFLLETFGMYALEGHALCDSSMVQIDLKEEFDPKYFMPYVPGYMHVGGSDLVLFSVTAASGETAVPAEGAKQVDMAIDKMVALLGHLGASFEDVIVAWNRVPNLDEDEEDVLMTRSRKGLNKPLAESVIGLASRDPVGTAPDGTPLRIEYVVVAQVPKQQTI